MLMEQMMDFTNLTSGFMLAVADPASLGFNVLTAALGIGAGASAARKQRRLMEEENRKLAAREKRHHGGAGSLTPGVIEMC